MVVIGGFNSSNTISLTALCAEQVPSYHVETPEEIAVALERAEQALGPGRVQYAHPDCGFWMLKRSVADRKIAALVKVRDLYLGRCHDARV